MSKVKNGDVVKVHYTGRLKDGSIFDSSEGRDPLEFTVGSGQMIQGFDEGVVGMEPGEKKTLEIPSDKAYGPRRDEMVAKVKRCNVPEDINPEVGQILQVAHPEGFHLTVTVTEVSEEFVVLDGNSPLAGEDLVFEVELVSLESA